MKPNRMLKLSVTAGLIGSLVVMTGCQNFNDSSNAKLAPEPPENGTFHDTNQPIRDWNQSVATIQNGDTTAGSPGLRYRTRDDLEPYYVPVAEVGVFVANAVTMPYTRHQEKGTQVSTGIQFPPTHTAMPALPPEKIEAPQPYDTTPVEPTPEPTTDPATEPTPVSPDETPAVVAPSEVLSSIATQPNAPAFSISGTVVRAGAFEATGDKKLSEVVVAAGPTAEDPSKVRISIARQGEEPATTTLAELQAGNVQDIVIQGGDVIIISIDP